MTEDTEAELLTAEAELDRHARHAAEWERTARTAVLVVAALIAAFLLGWIAPWAPGTAHAAIPDTKTIGTAVHIKGTADVCTTGLGKSWTRKLERKANRAFRQHVDVHRRSEDHLGGCDVVVWKGGRVALDYIAGDPAANPRFHVYTGPYAMVDAEVNVGTITPRKQRPATIVKALRVAGVR